MKKIKQVVTAVIGALGLSVGAEAGTDFFSNFNNGSSGSSGSTTSSSAGSSGSAGADSGTASGTNLPTLQGLQQSATNQADSNLSSQFNSFMNQPLVTERTTYLTPIHYYPQLNLYGLFGSYAGGVVDGMIPIYTFAKGLFYADIQLQITSQDFSEGNFGLGYRQIAGDEVILGGYGFFDIARTGHGGNFTQGTFGFEALTVNWDFGWDFYIPFTQKRMIAPIDTGFQLGNKLIVEQGATYESALAGTNLEIGRRIWGHTMPMRIFAGFYTYGFGLTEGVTDIYGGRFRFEQVFSDNFALVGSYQYDNENNSQYLMGLRVTIGGVSLPNRDLKDDFDNLRARLMDPIERDMPLMTEKYTVTTKTISPFNVYYVDDASSANGDGTVEKPFNNLQAAAAAAKAGDEIYLLPATTYEWNNSQQQGLADNVSLIGAGEGLLWNNHVFIAPTPNMPSIVNVTGNSAIELRDGDVIKGLVLDGSGMTGTPQAILQVGSAQNIVLSNLTVRGSAESSVRYGVTIGDGASGSITNLTLQNNQTGLQLLGNTTGFTMPNGTPGINGITAVGNITGVEISDAPNSNSIAQGTIYNLTLTNNTTAGLSVHDTNTGGSYTFNNTIATQNGTAIGIGIGTNVGNNNTALTFSQSLLNANTTGLSVAKNNATITFSQSFLATNNTTGLMMTDVVTLGSTSASLLNFIPNVTFVNNTTGLDLNNAGSLTFNGTLTVQGSTNAIQMAGQNNLWVRGATTLTGTGSGDGLLMTEVSPTPGSTLGAAAFSGLSITNFANGLHVIDSADNPLSLSGNASFTQNTNAGLYLQGNVTINQMPATLIASHNGLAGILIQDSATNAANVTLDFGSNTASFTNNPYGLRAESSSQTSSVSVQAGNNNNASTNISATNNTAAGFYFNNIGSISLKNANASANPIGADIETSTTSTTVTMNNVNFSENTTTNTGAVAAFSGVGLNFVGNFAQVTLTNTTANYNNVGLYLDSTTSDGGVFYINGVSSFSNNRGNGQTIANNGRASNQADAFIYDGAGIVWNSSGVSSGTTNLEMRLGNFGEQQPNNVTVNSNSHYGVVFGGKVANAVTRDGLTINENGSSITSTSSALGSGIAIIANYGGEPNPIINMNESTIPGQGATVKNNDGAGLYVNTYQQQSTGAIQLASGTFSGNGAKFSGGNTQIYVSSVNGNNGGLQFSTDSQSLPTSFTIDPLITGNVVLNTQGDEVNVHNIGGGIHLMSTDRTSGLASSVTCTANPNDTQSVCTAN